MWAGGGLGSGGSWIISSTSRFIVLRSSTSIVLDLPRNSDTEIKVKIWEYEYLMNLSGNRSETRSHIQTTTIKINIPVKIFWPFENLVTSLWESRKHRSHDIMLTSGDPYYASWISPESLVSSISSAKSSIASTLASDTASITGARCCTETIDGC